MVMALDFHTKDPGVPGDTLKLSLFTDLCPSAGSEAALITLQWAAILGAGTLNYFAEKIMLMKKQKVNPTAGWDKAVSQLEAWSVFYTFSLGDDIGHPATYEMFFLVEEKIGVCTQLRAQYCQKPTVPAALLCLIRQEFNESFWQALERWQRFRWQKFRA